MESSHQAPLKCARAKIRSGFGWCLALAVVAGCGESGALVDSGDQSLTAVSLEVGTGQATFEAVPPVGGSVELVHGPQGGYHFLGRCRFTGLPPDVYLSFRVTPVEGGDPVNNPADRVHRMAQQGLVQDGDAWESAFGELVILTAIRSPADVVGRRFVWETSLQSAATHQVVTAQREITIVDEVP